MNQTERIARMEQIFDEADEAVRALSAALDRYEALLPRIDELRAYYTGPQWRRDYEDDEAGRLPQELRRGVLSQDGVHHLLELLEAQRGRMQSLK